MWYLVALLKVLRSRGCTRVFVFAVGLFVLWVLAWFVLVVMN